MSDLSRDHSRHSTHAGTPTRKQASMNPQPSCSLAVPEKGHSRFLSLVGLLQHATKVVIPGRIFIATMYAAKACLQLTHFTHLTVVASAQTLGGGMELTSPPQNTQLPWMLQGPGAVEQFLVLNSCSWLGRKNGHGWTYGKS